ncbi:MAG: polysaccharide lyase, partial [Prevotella sp.]|nr:polysaccharide lyase [Prevotella sp.]
MKKQILLSVFLMAFGVEQSFAQYPKVPKEDQAIADKMQQAAMAHSDSAWAVALPIVEKEAREG